MMAVPGATVKTLLEFLEDPHKAQPHFQNLDKIPATFSKHCFSQTLSAVPANKF
jgi:hypothetical protein